MTLPPKGLSRAEVVDRLESCRPVTPTSGPGGPSGSCTTPHDPDLEAVLSDASAMFTFHNGLNPDVPEPAPDAADVVDDAGDAPAAGRRRLAGFLTSGGTERS